MSLSLLRPNSITSLIKKLYYRMDKLDKSVKRFYESQFCELVKTEDWLSLTQEEVSRLVSSDALEAPESVIIDSILHWWSQSSSGEEMQTSSEEISNLTSPNPETLNKLMHLVRSGILFS